MESDLEEASSLCPVESKSCAHTDPDCDSSRVAQSPKSTCNGTFDFHCSPIEVWPSLKLSWLLDSHRPGTESLTIIYETFSILA